MDKYPLSDMAASYSGTTELNLDDKGRMAIPARYRDALLAQSEGRLVLTLGMDDCLLLFAESEWQPIEASFASVGTLASSKLLQIKRRLVGSAEPLEMDKAGRIQLPQRLRRLAGLEKEVALVGQGNKFELWNLSRWDEEMNVSVSFADDELPAGLLGL